MALVRINEDHVIESKGIRSIKHSPETGEIAVRYIDGTTTYLQNVSMTQVLSKLGRLRSGMRWRR